MTFSEFFDCIFLTADGNVNLRRDYGKVRKSLRAFLGQEYDVADVLNIFAPSWADGYFRFLSEVYLPNCSAKRRDDLDNVGYLSSLRAQTADNHFKILRRIVRKGTEIGVLPNIDALRGFEAYSRIKPVVSANVLSELDKVINSRLDDANKSLLTYLLCLCCGGVDPSDLALCKEMVSNNGFLAEKFAVLSKPASVEQIRSAFTFLNINLLRTTVLNDWLSIATGMAVADVDAIAEACGHRLADEEADVVKDINKAILQRWELAEAKSQQRFWIAISSFGRSAAELKEELLGSALAERLKDCIYCPCVRPMKGKRSVGRVSGVAAVLRNVLFVYVTEELARQIDQNSKQIWIFRQNRGKGAFARINKHELNRMRDLLNCFSSYDDVEFGVLDEGSEQQFEPNDVVVLNVPGYEGREAIVAKRDSQRSSAEHTYYAVMFTLSNGFCVTLSAPAKLIEKGFKDD